MLTFCLSEGVSETLKSDSETPVKLFEGPICSTVGIGES